MSRRLILCDCEGSQAVDADRLAAATGLPAEAAVSALCTRQIDIAAQAIEAGDAILCCMQEARRFDALAEEMGVAPPSVLDLRDRAGWTEDPRDTLPKMAALVADAEHATPADKTVDVISEGLCLIVGPAEVALEAAAQLAGHLAVTVLLPEGSEAPVTRAFDVVTGRLRGATGSLGRFRVRIDALRQLDPTGRGGFEMVPPRDGAESACDLILDLSGAQSLFPAPEKRDGYLRADPAHAPSVAKAVMDASHMVGTFEKTLHVRTEPMLCAHSRAEQTGCTRCLDLCPTGAITPNGDHVTVDPLVCAGCGACSAACPSGAIALDAPPVDATMRRIQTLAQTYLTAGGTAPRLLVTDEHGTEMVALAARFGRGLPADVIPIEVPALNGIGHAEAVAALAAGFAQVIWLPGPKTDRTALETQLALTRALASSDAARLLDTTDPDAMADDLYGETAPDPVVNPVRPMGTRRQIARQAATALHADAETLPLPDGAPYGAVLVDRDACTLCLSCVSLCPSGALGDNPDLPQLRFQEDACLQCGLCANVCPEDAISFAPRMNLTPTAFEQVVLNEEEPFACIECGALFGVKSTIERITEKLSTHSMFQDEKQLRMIQMCDDCRVKSQFHGEGAPFAGGERPRVRTTDDYLSKRRDH
ncbi:MAG: 4Fe-4S binding protein [Pseudomonadota bacterium]